MKSVRPEPVEVLRGSKFIAYGVDNSLGRINKLPAVANHMFFANGSSASQR